MSGDVVTWFGNYIFNLPVCQASRLQILHPLIVVADASLSQFVCHYAKYKRMVNL
jgi:hypothetical protein